MADPKDPRPPSRRTPARETAAQRAKAEERTENALKEQHRWEDALEALEKRRGKHAEERADLETTLTNNLKDRHKAYLDIYSEETQSLLQAEERYELSKKLFQEEEAILAELEKQIKAAERLGLLDKDRLATLKEKREEQEKLVKEEKDQLALLKAQAVEGKKLEKQMERMQKHAQYWAQSLFGITERSREIGKYFLDAEGNMKLLNGSVKLLGKHLGASVDKAGVIGATLEKAYEAFGALKKQAMDWSKSLATGPWEATQKFATDTRLQAQELGYDLEQMNAELIERSERTTRGLIMTSAESQKTYATMIQSSTQFRRVSQEESEAIQHTANALTRMGVSAQTTGKLWDDLQTIYGYSAEEANRATASTVNLARALNLDLNTVTTAATQNMEKLAIYAVPNVEKEFGKLLAMSLEMGISMDKLMGTMDKWTTFEGAATAAQTLNAVFSDLNISGVEMMRIQNTEGAGAAMMFLKRRLDEAGVTVDQFNNGPMRKLAGDLFGGGDAAAGMKILGKSTAEVQKAIEEAGGATASATDINKQLIKTVNETATAEQTKANRIDKARKEMQEWGDWWYGKKQMIDNWLASQPWVGIMAGMATMTASAIGGLVTMWATWAIKAVASARMVEAATTRAAMVRGGPMGGGVPMGVTSNQGGGQFAPGGYRSGASSQLPANYFGGPAAAAPGRWGKMKNFMKGGGGRMGAGVLGGTALALTPDQPGYANVAGTTAGYAGIGYSVAGPAGAIVGGVGGLAKSLIDWRLESDDPTWGTGNSGPSTETITIPKYHDGGTVKSDGVIVNTATGRPEAAVKAGETVTNPAAAAQTTAPSQLTIQLVLQDGTLIKSTTAAVDLLAPIIFKKMQI